MNPNRSPSPHASEHGHLDAPKGVMSGHHSHGATSGHAVASKRVPPTPVGLTTPPPLPPVKTLTEGVFSILIAPLRKAVAEEGYTTPTPIQEQAIPHLLEGRDLLGCAQTGTGKTAAFVLPLLQHITSRPRPPVRGRPRALILAPTRELAAQIGESVRAYGRHVPVKYTVIFGGAGQYPQVAALNRGVDIVVATPGRLLDLMGQGHAHLDLLEVFILDEADRMLDMGFIPDIRKIVATLPKKRQSLFFSATLPDEVTQLARTLVNHPVHVTIEPERPTVERIEQKILFVDKAKKDDLLVHLLKDPAVSRVVVFVQMKHAADKVTRKLTSAGVQAVAIHGNKRQSARAQAMAGFKAGRIRVLVATDIAARGIDVDDITHVINYDLPHEPETYVHRIGRTARAGASGDAVSFCSAQERDFLRAIEKLIRKSVPVNMGHPHHSEEARQATGAAARPPPRHHQKGGGGQGGGGHAGNRRAGGFRR